MVNNWENKLKRRGESIIIIFHNVYPYVLLVAYLLLCFFALWFLFNDLSKLTQLKKKAGKCESFSLCLPPCHLPPDVMGASGIMCCDFITWIMQLEHKLHVICHLYDDILMHVTLWMPTFPKCGIHKNASIHQSFMYSYNFKLPIKRVSNGFKVQVLCLSYILQLSEQFCSFLVHP